MEAVLSFTADGIEIKQGFKHNRSTVLFSREAERAAPFRPRVQGRSALVQVRCAHAEGGERGGSEGILALPDHEPRWGSCRVTPKAGEQGPDDEAGPAFRPNPASSGPRRPEPLEIKSGGCETGAKVSPRKI
jgi:hypothetical protein